MFLSMSEMAGLSTLGIMNLWLEVHRCWLSSVANCYVWFLSLFSWHLSCVQEMSLALCWFMEEQKGLPQVRCHYWKALSLLAHPHHLWRWESTVNTSSEFSGNYGDLGEGDMVICPWDWVCKGLTLIAKLKELIKQLAGSSYHKGLKSCTHQCSLIYTTISGTSSHDVTRLTSPNEHR